ncbi:MAG: hypothetical protein Q8Q11_03505 [bacterium]|nr:hypothetical protein [bacterium]MDZ4248203.1 hypothetical protein [Patescibacteria group bacterium]
MAEEETQKLQVLRQMLDSAEQQLIAARKLLAELDGKTDAAGAPSAGPAAPATAPRRTADFAAQAEKLSVSSEGRVIEGVFDGKDMMSPDKRKYPVPANYASKSKLVAGDVLKLTITDDGSYIYKQIGPAPRQKMVGTLTQEGNQYQVVAGGKNFNVLLASVTYFKAHPGDQISIIVPEDQEADWAAVDNLMMTPDTAGTE